MNTLDKLRSTYPGRVTLSAEEVALVLRHSDNRGVVQKVRERMKKGVYPDARKIDGRWHLPIDVVANILDPSMKAPSQVAPKQAGRKRAQIGPIYRFVRDARVWLEVIRLAGMTEDGLGLDLHEAEQEMHDAYWMKRAEREKATIMKALEG